MQEEGPGILEWPKSTYHLNGKDVECDCEVQVELFRHYLLAHIPEEYMRLCEIDYYGDAEAFKATTEYLEKWDSYKHHGLGLGYYSHSQGTGKTFLATLVGKELIKQGEAVLYLNFQDIMSLHAMPFEYRLPIEERIKDTTLLILDEVTRTISEAQRSFFSVKIEELIRYRTNYNRVTIITTNMNPGDLDKEYPRTFSLLSAKEMHIEVKGNDARKEGIYDINKLLSINGERRPLS